MSSPKYYFALVRHLGWGWIWFRLKYASRRRSGALRRESPIVDWSDMPGAALQLRSRTISAMSIGEQVVTEANEVLSGRYRLFSHQGVEAGSPPDWRLNQLSGETVPAQRHWSELGDFAFGDIKGVWELSRFPWAFALTRAYGRTGDGKYAEAFWRLFADWCDHNRPNEGANWMCGQEATFRLMAVVFAAEGLGVPGNQHKQLGRFVVATGRRIAVNLDYALSQKNNHGVSECVGLITAALLAPEHGESAAWLARGLRALEAQVDELVYEDGGFSQHSLIYHRVLLHDLVWALTRLECAGRPVPGWLLDGGRRATEFLLQLADRLTGLGPLYGPNDGANVLPLADAEFLDLRPVLQLSSALFRKEIPFPPGHWDEAMAWLAKGWEQLPRASDGQAPHVWHAPQAGCWQAANEHERLFLRCPTRFRHRPSQADMLHVDVWHGGQPVAMDAGSFSYNSFARFTALGSAAMHNAMTVAGIEPIAKFGRFLYLPWPKGAAADGESGAFQATHDGYSALGVEWTRTVRKRHEGGWTVNDRVMDPQKHSLKWHWRLADRPWKVEGSSVTVRDALGSYRIRWQSSVPVKVSLIRASPSSAYGWWSPAYAKIEPAYSLIIEPEPTEAITLQTELSADF